MRTILLGALALLLLAGCLGGGEETQAGSGGRTFTVGEMAIRPDGRILLAGLATRGQHTEHGYNAEYDECHGEGTATRDFAVVHVSPAGRVLESHSLSEHELDACAVEVTSAEIDTEGALVFQGYVREPPSLGDRLFGDDDGDPEEHERWYAARFDPEPGRRLDAEDIQHDDRIDYTYAWVTLPDGDLVAVEEDYRRQRLGPHGYSGTMSLMRWETRDSPLWSHPVRAISPKADLLDEEGEGWALFYDARRGFYGFAHYALVSGEPEVVLFRHRLDGRPDPAFGDRSRVLVSPDARWSFGSKFVVRAPGGDFVVAGEAIDYGRLIVRRFTPDGKPVERFDRAAAAAIQCGYVVDLEVQADGKLLIACGRRGRGSALVRLLPSGHLDRSFGRKGRLVVRRV